jgi:hypothetical protein
LGCSARQGGHQLAQKLTNLIFGLLISSSDTELKLPKGVSVMLGALLLINTDGKLLGFSLLIPKIKRNARPKKIRGGKIISGGIRLFFINFFLHS